MSGCAIVIIGRNEGERLKACLKSIGDSSDGVVYVDSGSTDGSVDYARRMGCAVVELGTSEGFTAARARNAGLERAVSLAPAAEFVQFVDGDCTLDPDWLAMGIEFLRANPAIAVVCGRRRERYPEATIYNQLCDIEWDTPVGPALACGGDAMMRIDAFRAVSGFDPRLIAGEEPELCLRLRERGWGIHRLDAEMTIHDAAMTRLGQWWRRSARAGYAFRCVSRKHRTSTEGFWIEETRSILIWGLYLPIAIVLLAVFTRGFGLALLAVYPLQLLRIYRASRRRGLTQSNARLYAANCLVGKVPQAIGVFNYYFDVLSGRRRGLIEYKSAPEKLGAPANDLASA